MAKVRLKITCNACGETFTKLIDNEKQKGSLKVVCPFCSDESKIAFEESSIKYVYRGGSKILD